MAWCGRKNIVPIATKAWVRISSLPPLTSYAILSKLLHLCATSGREAGKKVEGAGDFAELSGIPCGRYLAEILAHGKKWQPRLLQVAEPQALDAERNWKVWRRWGHFRILSNSSEIPQASWRWLRPGLEQQTSEGYTWRSQERSSCSVSKAFLSFFLYLLSFLLFLPTHPSLPFPSFYHFINI